MRRCAAAETCFHLSGKSEKPHSAAEMRRCSSASEALPFGSKGWYPESWVRVRVRVRVRVGV